jgi:hypothetical protein
MGSLFLLEADVQDECPYREHYKKADTHCRVSALVFSRVIINYSILLNLSQSLVLESNKDKVLLSSEP